MSRSRRELDSELQALIQQNHLTELLSADALDAMSDSNAHALLMQVRAHRDIELCLARDALTHSDDSVEDFTLEEMETAMRVRVWGGV